MGKLKTIEPVTIPERRGLAVVRRDHRKKSIQFSGQMLAEIEAEARRQGRSLSELVRVAWAIARPEMARFPTVEGDS